MKCTSCFLGRSISPSSTLNSDRVLYYLVTYGIARIEFYHRHKPSWLKYLPIHEITTGRAETARQIAGKAVKKVPRLWVASHKQDASYMLSHLKTVADPCMPNQCPIEHAEIQIRSQARLQEKELFPSRTPILQDH